MKKTTIFILLTLFFETSAFAAPRLESFFEPSHFSACRELNLTFIIKRKAENNQRIVQSALDEALHSCKDRRHFIIDPEIMTLGPSIEKAVLLKEVRTKTSQTIAAGNKQVQMIQSCFDSANSHYRSAKCQLIRKEERQHLSEMAQKARRYLALSHPYSLHTNRQQPLGEQAYQVPVLLIDEKLRKSGEENGLEMEIPLTETEKRDVQVMLQQHRPYQELVAAMKDSAYQQRPTSPKNFSFHAQIPTQWAALQRHFTDELHQTLSMAPALKHLLAVYDPRKSEPLSEEHLNEAYKKLTKDFKNLSAEEKKPSSSRDDCLLLQNSVFNEVLESKIKTNKEIGKKYCQLAENIHAQCESDEETRQAMHTLGLGGVCLLASPVACGVLGVSDVGQEWATEHFRSRRQQWEHSTGLRDWGSVVRQTQIEQAIKNGAPLALVGFPTAGFLKSTRTVLRTQKGFQNREQVNELFTKAHAGSGEAIQQLKEAEQQVLKEKFGVQTLSEEEQNSLYQMAQSQTVEKFETLLLDLPGNQRPDVLKKVLADATTIDLKGLSPARRITVVESLVEVRASRLGLRQQDEKIQAIKKCLGSSGPGQR